MDVTFMFREDLERKSVEIKEKCGKSVEVHKSNNKIALLYDVEDEPKIFKGNVNDCYTFLVGYLAALS